MSPCLTNSTGNEGSRRSAKKKQALVPETIRSPGQYGLRAHWDYSAWQVLEMRSGDREPREKGPGCFRGLDKGVSQNNVWKTLKGEGEFCQVNKWGKVTCVKEQNSFDGLLWLRGQQEGWEWTSVWTVGSGEKYGHLWQALKPPLENF